MVKSGKKVSPGHFQRAQIVNSHKEGYSERKIGVKQHISKGAVYDNIKYFRHYGTFSNMGRPRRSSIRDDTHGHVLTIQFVQTYTCSFACKRYKCNIYDSVMMSEQCIWSEVTDILVSNV